MAYLQFLGAAGTVTGSKHLINLSSETNGGDNFQVLVDCGLFQGPKEWRERNWQPMPIPAREIDAVILTHAHLDHCGWIPRLVKEGFRGPIYATAPTIDLCGILLPDSGHLQEEEAFFHNKQKSSKHVPALPLYTSDEAKDSLQYFKPVAVGELLQLRPNFSFRFVRAGHIVGSSMVEVTVTQNGKAKQLLFTGDIGRVCNPEFAPGCMNHSGPQEGEQADLMVMESTYGNRAHPKSDPRPELAQLIAKTVQRGGSVVVPAFAVERTQKFLFMIKELMESGKIPRVPVFADSPMAIQAVQVFLKYSDQFSDDTRELVRKYGSPLQWEGFTFASTADQSKRINDMRYPCIIVSSSGMVTGGRILHHLMLRLPDPKNLVLFIGFQSPGTRGAIIKSGAPSVRIFSQPVPIRAQIATLEQFSDHADTPELMRWLHTFKQKPSVTYLVHGEATAAQKLQNDIQAEMQWNVQVAKWLEKVPLDIG